MEDKIIQRPGERILLWFLLAFSIFVLIQALRIPHLENLSSSGAFPIFIALILIGSSLRILWKNRSRYNALNLGEEVRLARPFALPGVVVGYAAILLLYIVLTSPLHFLPSSYLFLVGSFLFLKGATLKKSFPIAALTLAVIYVLFQTIFKVILW
ncbi:MAG: tripartite tricarboxylate transporter TctB family protein [Deltaproteobacteria bacterium]|nr:tripartite tricarboxylate transporter TctB family protein [Deltaproteobacteria bacterium]